MKVLFGFGSSNFSGAEITAARLVDSIKGSVTASAFLPSGILAERLSDMGVTVHTSESLCSLGRGRSSYSRTWLALKLIRKFIDVTRELTALKRLEKYDVIHANSLATALYFLPTLILSKLRRHHVLWVWTSHDLSYYDRRIGPILANLCTYMYDRTIAVSQAVQASLPSWKRKTTVLYNGLDPDKFCFSYHGRQHFRDSQRFTDADTVFAIVGVIRKGKGHHILLDAFQKLSRCYENVALVIAGEFSDSEKDYRKTIEAMVRSMSRARVIMSGRIDDTSELYSGIDVLVNASIPEVSEPLGTTVIEAMSHERMVLASRTGGTCEIVDDGVDGLLFEAGNPFDLFEKMKFCCDELERLDAIRSHAREKVLKRFDVGRMAKDYMGILRQMAF